MAGMCRVFVYKHWNIHPESLSASTRVGRREWAYSASEFDELTSKVC